MAIEIKIGEAEHAFSQLRAGLFGTSPRKGRHAPRLRIPDPNVWKLNVYRGKEDGFATWRDTFELPTGSVWLGLDALVTVLRKKDVGSKREFEDLRDTYSPIPDGNSGADRKYAFLSNRLYMLLYTHLGVYPKKAIELSGKCGFTAHMLLHKE